MHLQTGNALNFCLYIALVPIRLRNLPKKTYQLSNVTEMQKTHNILDVWIILSNGGNRIRCDSPDIVALLEERLPCSPVFPRICFISFQFLGALVFARNRQVRGRISET